MTESFSEETFGDVVHGAEDSLSSGLLTNVKEFIIKYLSEDIKGELNYIKINELSLQVLKLAKKILFLDCFDMKEEVEFWNKFIKTILNLLKLKFRVGFA